MTSWRYALTVKKAIGRLVVLSLVIAIVLAAVSVRCDFVDDDCETVSIVASWPDGPGVFAGKITPDRARIGHDPADPPLMDDGLAVVWPAPPLLAAMPERAPHPAWYPRWTTLSLASLVGAPPNLPPRI